MKKGTKIGIVAFLVISAFLVYWFYFRNSTSVPGAINRADASLTDAMNSVASQYIDGGFPLWILEDADKRLASGDVVDYYLVNGKVTKAGALLATYDAEYFGYGYVYRDGRPAKNTGNEYALHEALHALLQAEKKKYV